MRKKKPIVLVTVDCLRADHAGFMGYRRPTTPFLDSVAGTSFVVPTAIVAGAPTYYSVPAILAARFPLALGRDLLGPGRDEPTLASISKDAGYATAAFNAGNPYISTRFGYGCGFDVFRDFLQSETASASDDNANNTNRKSWAGRLNRRLQELRLAMGPLGSLYDELYFEYCQRVTPVPATLDALRRFPSADVIVSHACEWLASVGDKPFFLWLHLMDPHSPYCPKGEAISQMGLAAVTPQRARYLNSYWNRSDIGPKRLQRHSDEIVALYDAGIRWVDEQVARLVEFLRQSSQWDDCIFALTADHGEEFLEHGGRYHQPSRLMEEIIHVPLLLRVPGRAKREVSGTPFSLIHLAPTLLDAAELPIPPAFQGRSLLPQLLRGEKFDDTAVSECVSGCTNPFHRENRMGPRILSVRESRYKLVIGFDPSADSLYDLEADPSERSPLPRTAQKPVRRRLLEVAREHLRRSSERLDSRTRLTARLRELQLEWARPFPQRTEI